MRSYGKVETESKIAIKKDAIQYSNESIRPYEDGQKVCKKRSKN